ncbi:hypothetical protein NHH03_13260 [Stieleria sp. TO1_6]|uniref:hypothetical protein n=1 Tax=Stieleria tagensis TaxID=2956795 RepID=UPI00209ADB7B|nr:hypothetical protein [Stieleria tagensis]MCO8122710.1 hypothetical protein [Stieleria tagensis]
MKAFGVRLAAGSVTILLGAIMAAQAQKDQQETTESAWQADGIPPGKAPSPIGTEKSFPPSRLMTAGDAVEALRPVDEEPLDKSAAKQPAAGQGVALVQHTESAGAMTLPDDDVALADESAEQAAGSPQAMTMSFPSFDDAPPLDNESLDGNSDTADNDLQPGLESATAPTGGPSVMMGVPIADTANISDNAHSQPEIKFVDTPPMAYPSDTTLGSAPPQTDAANSSFEQAAAELAAADVAPATDHLSNEMPADEMPANDLRSAAPMGLRGAPAMPAGLADEGLDANEFDSDQLTDYGNVSHSNTPPKSAQLTDSVDPNAGSPASLITPVMQADQLSGQPRLSSAPNSTMLLNREPPVQLQTNPQATLQQPEHASAAPTTGAVATGAAAMGAAAMGFASQPQIVDQDNPQDNASAFNTGAYNASAFNTGNDHAAGDPMAYQAAPRSTLAAPALPAPTLPAPTMPASTLPAPAYDAAAANTPNQSIYQGVGYKSAAADGMLPPAPTLASPGERYLDGPQAPSVVIHKRAPAEVKVGKPASFVITVKNVGGSKALDVQVHDRVPNGMTLTDATPRPNPKFQPELFWELGDLEPNQERTITLQLTPEQEGELGSVARVTFQAAASVRTISTRPELKVVQHAPKEVLIGQQLEIELEVSNPGTGEATGVIMQEDVPDGLEHPQGKQLDNLIGSLGPGETRRQILRMRAVKPGIIKNQIRVKADDGLEHVDTVAVQVVAPELQVAMTGPSRRFLERQATYELEIANTGTYEASNVELSVQLDRGFTFVKTDFEGQYDSTRHAVFWSLPKLQVGQSGTVPLTLLPVEAGNRVLRTAASADLGVQATTESQVVVDSIAELTFSINDSADPIEINGQTTYEIRVKNTGSRDDTNVKVAIQLPPGLQLVENGDFTQQGQGVIAFTPRGLLKANDEMVYHVKAKGVTAGHHLVKAIVTSDQCEVPVTKEESIKVYADH